MTNQQIICGNNIELLKKYPDNHFDSIVTDAPYGLGKEPNAVELMKDWVEKGYHEISGTGFMGKEWDAFVPQPLFWKEAFRVLKHGGYVLSFFGTRTYDWGVMAMRFAGFEVRDTITWHYGCLSDDTEILTKSGYIQYHKFIKLPNFEEQEILIYDVKNDVYSWEKPERWNNYNIHKDTCYRIKSDSTDQIVSKNHRCIIERNGELLFKMAEELSEMEYMPTLPNNFHFLQKQESEILQQDLQWSLQGSRLEEMGQNRLGYSQFTTEQIEESDYGRKEWSMERGNNLSKEEGVLFGSETEICKMSEGVYTNVKEGRIYIRVQINNGETDKSNIDKEGVCASYRPQSNEQRYNEFDAICNEQGTQEIRMGKSYSTTLATIEPIEYTGVIFCPTVTTGAFVARRNNKVFITGNSGFPKSHNISKALDKMVGAERDVVCENPYNKNKGGKDHHSEKCLQAGKLSNITAPSTDAAKQWDGWGSALKPASEPIVLARKPLEKGLTIAENVLKWGTGGINIDGCRIGNELMINQPAENNTLYNSTWKGVKTQNTISEGRFPANVIFSHHEDCVCNGIKKVKGGMALNIDGNDMKNNIYGKGFKQMGGGFTNSDGIEEIENWDCVDGCPIKELDEQSGVTKSQRSARGNVVGDNVYNLKLQEDTVRGHSDKGTASRFFYTAKSSKGERNKGLEHNKWFYNLELITKYCSFTEQNLFIWQKEELNQSTDLNGEAQPQKGISEGMILIAEGSEWNTILCGKNTMDLFPSAIKFTTKTGLSQIIELKTLNYYQHLNTSDCIADVIETNKKNGLNLAENVGLKNLLKLIFIKEKTEFPLGVRLVAKKMQHLISVKDAWQKSNIHSTVKPVKLMQYLVRLITPQNGIVLDPFNGSGTTGIAAKLEGLNYVGLELDSEYCKISEARIAAWEAEIPKMPEIQIDNQLNLF